jgi:hypothetical protein
MQIELRWCCEKLFCDNSSLKNHKPNIFATALLWYTCHWNLIRTWLLISLYIGAKNDVLLIISWEMGKNVTDSDDRLCGVDAW